MYLKSLSAISPSIRFNTIKDNIVVTQKNENIGYIYSFPKSDFPFEGTTASFIDYKELVSILSMMSVNCDMTQDPQNLRYITFNDAEENIKVNYTMSDDDIDFSTGPLKFDMGLVDASIELSIGDFSKIKKFINAVSAEKIDIKIKSGTCTMKFFRDKKGDSCEMKFAVESTETIEYTITADFFILTPDGSVTLDFRKDGIIRLKYNMPEGIAFQIFTGIMED
jgi:hypothetical protein